MKIKIKFNLIIFIALMGSAVLALLTKILFKNDLSLFFSYFLEMVIIILFSLYFICFIVHLFKKESFFNNLKNPKSINFYSAIPIVAALISIMLIMIGLPYFYGNGLNLSLFFWVLSLILGLFFLVVVPINLKFRAKVEDVLATWFLPPVGIFVIVTAGSIVATKFVNWAENIIIINFLLLGPAFILYFLTLNLIYFRSKFYEINQQKILPTFNILLAPVGVSILATLNLAKLILEYNFLGWGDFFVSLSKIYSLIIYGYGLWVVLGLIYFYIRMIIEKSKIDFSEIWWAFIFPLAAFTLATITIYNFIIPIIFFKLLTYILYIILLLLWVYIIIRQSYDYLKK